MVRITEMHGTDRPECPAMWNYRHHFDEFFLEAKPLGGNRADFYRLRRNREPAVAPAAPPPVEDPPPAPRKESSRNKMQPDRQGPEWGTRLGAPKKPPLPAPPIAAVKATAALLEVARDVADAARSHAMPPPPSPPPTPSARVAQPSSSSSSVPPPAPPPPAVKAQASSDQRSDRWDHRWLRRPLPESRRPAKRLDCLAQRCGQSTYWDLPLISHNLPGTPPRRP
jgi:hypothetical protein